MTGIGENTLAQPVKPPLRERRACLAKLVKNRLTLTGEDAAALLDAYGVWDVPLGDLDLTPGLIERARAERGDAPLA